MYIYYVFIYLFTYLNVQTSYGALPDSYSMITEGSPPLPQRPKQSGITLAMHIRLMRRSSMIVAVPPLPFVCNIII